MGDIPTKPASITPEFLSSVLGSCVESVRWTPIGAGLVGDSIRLQIGHREDATAHLPTTLAAKIPAADSTSRSTAVSMQLYEKEVGFYRHVAPHISTRTPRIYFAEHDADSGDFLLLMEDCGPAEQGDQLTSCSLSQARHAVQELAGLHGPTYENTALIEMPFLAPNAKVRAFAAAGFPGATDAFLARYKGKMSVDQLDTIRRLGALSDALYNGPAPMGPCIVHGDFRLDNLLFSIRDGREPMVTLDWQTLSVGDPLTDLGYFMGAGIGSDLRNASEADLLSTYRRALIANGGPDLGDIRTSEGYARGAIHGVATAVFSAAFVEHNARSEAIFQSMAEGASDLVMKLDALRILEDSDGS